MICDEILEASDWGLLTVRQCQLEVGEIPDEQDARRTLLCRLFIRVVSTTCGR